MTPADLYKQESFQAQAREAAALVIGTNDVVCAMAQRDEYGGPLRIELYPAEVSAARELIEISGADDAAHIPNEGSATRPIFFIMCVDEFNKKKFRMIVDMRPTHDGAWRFDAEDFGIVEGASL